jgi:hypothetical protein
MGADEQEKQPNEIPSAETDKALDPEEAKRQAFRKLKPVGPIMKPPSKDEVLQFLDDPESQERDHLLDAMPRPETDDQDGW